MKRLFPFFFVLFVCLGSFLSAQTPVIEKHGPTLETFNQQCEQVQLIGENEKYAYFYFSSLGNQKKADLHTLVTYNLHNNVVTERNMVTPLGFHHLHSVQIDDKGTFNAYFYRVNPETQNFEYAVAAALQERHLEETITPKQRLSIHLSGRGEVSKYVVQSPDQSKYAINFIVPTDKNQAPYFYTFVYDRTGKELWHQKFIPAITGSKFSVQDVQLNNDGELLLLLYTSRGKDHIVIEPTVQLFICNKDGLQTATQPIDFGYVTSMKMLQLKNKDYFVAGYYEGEYNGYSSGYFNIIFDDYTRKTISQMHNAFAETKEPVIVEGISDKSYFVKCDHLYELSEKTIVMMGEQYNSIIDGKHYVHHLNDIFVHQFMLNGHDMGYNRIQKHQKLTTATAVSTRSHGERISGTFLNQKGTPERIASFHELALSYYPIRSGDQLYVLFTDHLANYTSDHQQLTTADLSRPESLAIVLTKINYNMDRKVIWMPESKNDYLFRGILLNDDSTIYMGLAGKKSFLIEHFTLNERWSWDR